MEWVAQRGFDKQMGGRALKRQIERDLTALSAEQLVSTYSDNPIIFEIELKEDRLRPKITSLQFEDLIDDSYLPVLPKASEGRRFYNRLIKVLQRIENDIERHEPDTDDGLIVIGSGSGEHLDWQYYDFKNQIAALKEKLQTLKLGFSDRYFREAPAIPLRLKKGELTPRRTAATKGVRENYKDQLFQQEALKELSEAYEFAPAQFDSQNTELIDNYLDVAFLKIASKGFLSGTMEQVTLKIESAIVGLGEKEVQFLLQLYIDFLQHMDISHEVNKAKAEIHIEGHSLRAIFEGEIGIHLFYIAHQNPIPIKFSIIAGRQSSKLSPKVIRIYDGNNTLTDLRTGFSNEVYITPEEFKLLVFAGIHPSLR